MSNNLIIPRLNGNVVNFSQWLRIKELGNRNHYQLCNEFATHVINYIEKNPHKNIYLKSNRQEFRKQFAYFLYLNSMKDKKHLKELNYI